MAEGPNYDVAYRRRREDRTNYKKRLALLKSGEHRAVIRMSNRHAQVQIIAYSPDGDQTVVSAVSSQLQEYGWDQHTGNIPAAYLTGLLAGYKAQEEGVSLAVPDFGVRDQQYESRYYAALRGLIDSGLAMDAEEKVFPSSERLNGGHIAAYADSDIDAQVETVKDTISDEHGDA